MKHAQIMHAVRRRFRKIDAAYRKVIKNFQTDDIHRFRVEMKKLKAFLLLAENGSDHDRRLKFSKRARKFYEKTGAIRTLQLQQQYAAEAEPEAIQTALADDIAGMERWRRDKGMFGSEEKRILHRLPDRLSAAAMKTFFRSLTHDLRELLRNVHPNEDTLHQLRKLLKNIWYTRTYARASQQQTLPPILCDNGNVKDITEALGAFRDVGMRISLLGKGLSNKQRMFRKEWAAERKQIRKQIDKELYRLRNALQ